VTGSRGARRDKQKGECRGRGGRRGEVRMSGVRMSKDGRRSEGVERIGGESTAKSTSNGSALREKRQSAGEVVGRKMLASPG